MKDETKQILSAWERPEASADLAERIIARAGEARPVRQFPRMAIAASLVLALAVGYAMQRPGAVQSAQYSIDGVDILADVDFSDGEDEFASLILDEYETSVE